MVESKADQPRLLRLKEIESTIRDQSNEKNLYQSEAPAGYENLTFEEKNAGKYMCTFPYPYMNGYLHLGKSKQQLDAPINLNTYPLSLLHPCLTN